MNTDTTDPASLAKIGEGVATESLEKPRNRCVARVASSAWSDDRGLSFKRTLMVQKKLSTEYGREWIQEDAANIGVIEVIKKIINFNEVPDGLYEVVTCNESHDWESNTLDDYDYKLIPFTQ